MDRRKVGKDAEKIAEKFLQHQGLKLIERNAYCRFGEIDLIMRDPDSDTLIFVEVRQRRSRNHGGAANSVDFHKQAKLVTTAQFLLGKHPAWSRMNCRFDVIAFEGEATTATPMWYKDAFRP